MDNSQTKTIIFVVNESFFNGDGYTARIIMEMEKLIGKFNVILLVPDKRNPFPFPQGILIKRYKFYGKDRYYYIQNKSAATNALRELLVQHPEAVVCGESLIPSLYSYEVTKRMKHKFILDYHGIEPVEFMLYHKGLLGKIISKYLFYKEKQILNMADGVITVTDSQYEYWQIGKYHMTLPMLPSNQFLKKYNCRDEIRHKLGIPINDNIFLYSGQNQKWQMCDETIKYYNDFFNKDSNWLVIYTKTIDSFKEILARYDIKNYRILTVPYAEMGKYVSACDYGFCIRNSSIINKVASPTKILEYLSQNVVPILTEHIGDFSKMLSNNELALIINSLDKLPNKKTLDIEDRGYQFVKSYTSNKEREYLDFIDGIYK